MLKRELSYFLAALGYFTRVPVPAWVGFSAESLQQAARYLPAVGLLVGGVSAAVFWGAAKLWPVPVAVLLAMVASIAVTGAFPCDCVAQWHVAGFVRPTAAGGCAGITANRGFTGFPFHPFRRNGTRNLKITGDCTPMNQ